MVPTSNSDNIGLTIPGNWSFEIRRISCEIHPEPYKSKCFSKNSSVWWMQGGGYDQGFHEIHEIRRISKLWAFAWWSSIGLSFFERPKIGKVQCSLPGLDFNVGLSAKTDKNFKWRAVFNKCPPKRRTKIKSFAVESKYSVTDVNR